MLASRRDSQSSASSSEGFARVLAGSPKKKRSANPRRQISASRWARWAPKRGALAHALRSGQLERLRQQEASARWQVGRGERPAVARELERLAPFGPIVGQIGGRQDAAVLRDGPLDRFGDRALGDCGRAVIAVALERSTEIAEDQGRARGRGLAVG